MENSVKIKYLFEGNLPLYICAHIHTHTHTYIYIYIYIYLFKKDLFVV